MALPALLSMLLGLTALRIGHSPPDTTTRSSAPRTSNSDLIDSGPRVAVCGTHLCRYGRHWFMYGATVYDPGLKPPPSGIDNPAGTVALARAARLNTIRLVNYYPNVGDPTTVPFDESRWVKVDQMIAAAAEAGMTVSLDLADYRNILWNDCVNPYTADWSHFISFVVNRTNTITGERYATDSALSFVSIAGEPLRVGDHTFMARTTHAMCTLSYSTKDLTDFYRRTLAAWKQPSATVSVNTGGLGYLDFDSGIDWRAIFALHDNDACGIKTYGGMLNFAPTVTAYCAKLGKPVLDEEFGWKQADGDASRARAFSETIATLKALGVAGAAFWNLGYEVLDKSYEVNPRTPLTFAAVQRNAP